MTRNERIARRVMEMRRKLAELKLQAAAESLADVLAKYRPDQPRVPRGHPTGGQWTLAGGGNNAAADAGAKPSSMPLLVASKWNEGNRMKCELQLEKDLFQCRMMPWNPYCENQAQSRFTACMKDNDIPDFFHVL